MAGQFAHRQRRAGELPLPPHIMPHVFMFMPVLALALFLFLPRPFALVAYLPVALGSLVIAYKAMQAQRQAPAGGREAMIGDRAVVVNDSGRETRVRYKNEIWHAVSSQALDHGQQVKIKEVKGLTLWVTPFGGDRT